MMTKEQIIELLEERISQAHKLDKHYEQIWRASLGSEHVDSHAYTQHMMWYATCVALENLLEDIEWEQYQNG